MGFEFNFDWSGLIQGFYNFMSLDPLTMAIQIFLNGGWIVLLILMMLTLYELWLDAKQDKYVAKWKFVLLAINAPKNNELSPKVVENIFASLAGAQSNSNLMDKYWVGKKQESFSFELVSLGGYTQFLVRTPSHFRDLIEAAIYSQYPDAEIMEVADYTDEFKGMQFPNPKYDLWGAELVLVKDYPYPIKTYPEFEHQASESFIDPMSGVLEILSRLSPGENAWLQLVVTPQKPPGWGEKAKEVVKKMMGQSYDAPIKTSDKIMNAPVSLLGGAASMITTGIFGEGDGKAVKKEEDQWKMFKMSPRGRNLLEAVENKLSKHCFAFKFRLVYIGEKQVFNKGRGVAAILGSLQQFSSADANGFKPGSKTKTSADYFNVAKRIAKKQKKILDQYIGRSPGRGEDKDNLFLCSEELATLWHFPVMTVKVSQFEKTTSKKSAPPTRLPYNVRVAEEVQETVRTRAVPGPSLPDNQASEEGKSFVPNLPVLEEKPIIEKQSTEVEIKKPIERPKASPPSNLPTV